MNEPLLNAVISAFEAERDPERAVQAQAYMKSALLFYGLPLAKVRKTARLLEKEYPLSSYEQWRDTAVHVHETATRRELLYAANTWLMLPRYRKYQTGRMLPVYKRLIARAAWWDIVDELCKRAGDVLRAEPKETARIVRKWASDTSIWVRRAAILCQLGYKERIDLQLLYDCIEPSLGDREFFLRKAIGWSLREVAHWNPNEISSYVDQHRSRLSPLSIREALKPLKS